MPCGLLIWNTTAMKPGLDAKAWVCIPSQEHHCTSKVMAKGKMENTTKEKNGKYYTRPLTELSPWGHLFFGAYQETLWIIKSLSKANTCPQAELCPPCAFLCSSPFHQRWKIHQWRCCWIPARSNPEAIHQKKQWVMALRGKAWKEKLNKNERKNRSCMRLASDEEETLQKPLSAHVAAAPRHQTFRFNWWRRRAMVRAPTQHKETFWFFRLVKTQNHLNILIEAFQEGSLLSSE